MKEVKEVKKKTKKRSTGTTGNRNGDGEKIYMKQHKLAFKA